MVGIHMVQVSALALVSTYSYLDVALYVAGLMFIISALKLAQLTF